MARLPGGGKGGAWDRKRAAERQVLAMGQGLAGDSAAAGLAPSANRGAQVVAGLGTQGHWEEPGSRAWPSTFDRKMIRCRSLSVCSGLSSCSCLSAEPH